MSMSELFLYQRGDKMEMTNLLFLRSVKVRLSCILEGEVSFWRRNIKCTEKPSTQDNKCVINQAERNCIGRRLKMLKYEVRYCLG